MVRKDHITFLYEKYNKKMKCMFYLSCWNGSLFPGWRVQPVPDRRAGFPRMLRSYENSNHQLEVLLGLGDHSIRAGRLLSSPCFRAARSLLGSSLRIPSHPAA